MKNALPLVLILAGCGAPVAPHATPHAAPPSSVGAAATVTIAPPPASPVEDTPCPPIDLAALEPKPPVPDARVVSLAEIFPREEARTAGAPPLVIDLGRVPFRRHPGGDPGGNMGVGMGWQGLSADWVKDELSPEVAASFQVWIAAQMARSASLRGAYLLGERRNLLRAVPPDDDGFGLRCVIAARARAEEEATTQEKTANAEATRLIGRIEGRPLRSPAEKLLLGYLLAERVPYDRGSARAELERSLQLFAEVVDDTKARAELRARAAERTASIYLRGSEQVRGIAALQRVLGLTKDRDLKIETLIKIAALTEGAAAREKLLEQILAELDRGIGGWRVAQTLGELAELRLERGAFALARDAAARCAREVRNDFPEEPDPWSCASTLAQALGELGGAPQGVDVPLPFLGPLSLQLMQGAIARFDRDEARHAGELLLARLPGAPQAPQVLDILISITDAPQAKSLLTSLRARSCGPGSAWLGAQRARLAPRNELPALDAALAHLVAPPLRLGSPAPVKDDERRAELLRRLDQAIAGCEADLAGAPGDIALHIDTTRSAPSASVRGASAKITACLSRSAESHFRSVGPATIRATLFGQ